MRDITELTGNIKNGRGSAHAYIIEGGTPEAREEFVRMLMSGLGVHGLDTVRMEMSGKNGYRVEDAGAFIERLEMGAYGSCLAGIIDDADCLGEIVQNKLLKTLEEPRDKVLLLLCTSNRDSLLSTVRSRCSVLRIGDYMDVPDEDGEEKREGLMAAAALMTGRDAAFFEFRDAVSKHVKSRQDALNLIDMAEDILRDKMIRGEDALRMAAMTELAEKARMDIERDMDRSRALKRLYLEMREQDAPLRRRPQGQRGKQEEYR